MDPKDLKVGEFYIFKDAIYLYNGIDRNGKYPNSFIYSFTVVMSNFNTGDSMHEIGTTSRWAVGFIGLLKPLDKEST